MNASTAAQFSTADFARVEQLTAYHSTDSHTNALQAFDFDVYPESTASTDSYEDDGSWHVNAGHVRFVASLGESTPRAQFRRQAARFESAVRAFAAAHASA